MRGKCQIGKNWNPEKWNFDFCFISEMPVQALSSVKAGSDDEVAKKHLLERIEKEALKQFNNQVNDEVHIVNLKQFSLWYF